MKEKFSDDACENIIRKQKTYSKQRMFEECAYEGKGKKHETLCARIVPLPAIKKRMKKPAWLVVNCNYDRLEDNQKKSRAPASAHSHKTIICLSSFFMANFICHSSLAFCFCWSHWPHALRRTEEEEDENIYFESRKAWASPPVPIFSR